MSPRIITVGDFISLSRPELDWIVPGLIPKPSWLMLLGAPKAGKTFLSVDVGRRVGQGLPLFGHPTVPTKVLYIEMDTREPVWRDMLRKLTDSGVEFGPNFFLAHPDDQLRPLNLMTTETQDWFRAILKEADPGLVILDVFREMHNGDENDSTSMKIVCDVLEKIFKGRAVLMLHHSKKLPEDIVDPSPANASRGSSYIPGKVDGFWLLHKNILKIESRYDEPRKLKAIRLENGLWDFPDLAAQITMVDNVLSLCREFPKESHSWLSKIAHERWNLSRASYYRHLAGRQCVHNSVDVLGKSSPLTESGSLVKDLPSDEESFSHGEDCHCESADDDEETRATGVRVVWEIVSAEIRDEAEVL